MTYLKSHPPEIPFSCGLVFISQHPPFRRLAQVPGNRTRSEGSVRNGTLKPFPLPYTTVCLCSQTEQLSDPSPRVRCALFTPCAALLVCQAPATTSDRSSATSPSLSSHLEQADTEPFMVALHLCLLGNSRQVSGTQFRSTRENGSLSPQLAVSPLKKILILHPDLVRKQP